MRGDLQPVSVWDGLRSAGLIAVYLTVKVLCPCAPRKRPVAGFFISGIRTCPGRLLLGRGSVAPPPADEKGTPGDAPLSLASLGSFLAVLGPADQLRMGGRAHPLSKMSEGICHPSAQSRARRQNGCLNGSRAKATSWTQQTTAAMSRQCPDSLAHALKPYPA